MNHKMINQILSENWFLNQIPTHIEKLDNGSPNDVYKIIFPSNTYVLKKTKLAVNPGWYDTQIVLLSDLQNAGIQLSLPIKTVLNSIFAYYKDENYQLFDYVEGKRYKLNDIEMLTQVALLVSKMHSVKFSKNSIIYKSAFNDLEKWLLNPIENFERLKNQLLSIGHYGVDIEEYIEELEKNFLWLEKKAPKANYMDLPHSITHGELHHTNIIFKDTKLKALIDYDSIQIRPRIYDVARSMLFLSRKKRGSFEVNENFVETYLQLYCQKINLEIDEIELIPIILLYYFIPTAEYVKQMEKSDQLSWYLPWTLAGMRYIKKYFSAIVIKSYKKVKLD